MLLFFAYLVIARFRRKFSVANKLIPALAVVMFLFSTVHVSLGFQRLIEGFIYLRDEPGGPAAFFSNVSIPANVAKVIIHTINSILGDSIVVCTIFQLVNFSGSISTSLQVWRCYHVWGKSWLICLGPILLIMGSAGM